MIIVKTTNGDRFINEAECLQVNHLRDTATVEVWPASWGKDRHRQDAIPLYYIIQNVEAVIYTNAAQPTEWKDEGSAIRKLEEQRSQHLDIINRLKAKLRDFGCEL